MSIGQPELQNARPFLVITNAFGAACAYTRSIALRVPSPASNALGISMGHTSEQSLHIVHLSMSTKRGRWRTVTLKLPMSPSTFNTSDMVSTSMLMSRMHSTSFGEMMHVAQSPVGKVLSRRDMVPPTAGFSSIKYTRYPAAERSSAAWMPATPAPRTSTAPHGSCN